MSLKLHLLKTAVVCLCRIYLYVVNRKFETRKTENARRVVKPFKVGMCPVLCAAACVAMHHTPTRYGAYAFLLR